MKKVFDCPHGFEKATQCLDCMEEGPIGVPEVDPRVTVEFWTVAKFESSCPLCQGKVYEGDSIGSSAAGWVCGRCGRT